MSAREPHPRAQPTRRRPVRAIPHALLWLVTILFAIPLLCTLTVSLRSADDAAAPGIGFLPQVTNPDASPIPISLPRYWSALAHQISNNYHTVWTTPSADFPLYFHNSLSVAILSTLGMTISSAVVAYGFSRITWPGRDALFILVLATLTIPQAVVIAPQFILFKHLGLIGSLAPLWLPYCFGGGFSIFLLRQFFLTIPRELDEAARIDGCSHLRILFRVIAPLSKPALAAVMLFQFIASWNDFLSPLVFINHLEHYTLPLGLQMFQGTQTSTPWNLVMAASVLTILPVLAIYTAARRVFVEGVATQGIKE